MSLGDLTFKLSLTGHTSLLFSDLSVKKTRPAEKGQRRLNKSVKRFSKEETVEVGKHWITHATLRHMLHSTYGIINYSIFITFNLFTLSFVYVLKM